MKAYCHTTVIMDCTDLYITFTEGKAYDYKIIDILDDGVCKVHLINDHGRDHSFGESINGGFDKVFKKHFYDIKEYREKIIDELVD